MKITLTDANGIKTQYESLGQAIKENGATSSMNTMAALRFLQDKGFDTSIAKNQIDEFLKDFRR